MIDIERMYGIGKVFSDVEFKIVVAIGDDLNDFARILAESPFICLPPGDLEGVSF